MNQRRELGENQEIMDDESLPDVDSVVMIEVKSTDETGAWVTLLEYNVQGRIVESSCCKHTVVGRIEPAVVREITVSDDVDGERKVSISLRRDGIIGFERRLCEVRYLEMKYVHSILQKVAMSFETSDETTDNLAQLPSMVTLSSRVFLKTLPRRLRRELKKAMRTVKYDSWRMGGSERYEQVDPFLILPSKLIQKLGLCWAFALVRHFEALLKLKKMMPMDKHLSVQDLINKTPHQAKEGDLEDLFYATQILKNVGIVTEEECPLTWKVPTTEESARFREFVTGTEFRAKSAAVVFHDAELGINDIKSFLDDNSPVTASIIWFDSYAENNPHGVDIYKPTDEEWKAFKAGRSSRDKTVHTMLLTGSGVDENGVPYWEFMDDKGDVENGDRGFLRIIIEYVDIQV